MKTDPSVTPALQRVYRASSHLAPLNNALVAGIQVSGING